MSATAAMPARRRMARALPATAGVLVALALWQVGAIVLEGAYILAGPVEVAAYIAGNAPILGRALAETATNAAAGFVLGNAAAVVLALVAVAAPRSEALVRALALVVFCLPLVATGPILRVLFGPGAGPQITLAALAVYYTTFVPLVVGLRALPAAWLDLVASYGRGRWAALLYVRVFAAVPYLVAGLQIAAPAAFLGAMIGEFTGAERGLGVLALRAMRGLDVPATWALASIAAAASILVYLAVGALGRRLWPDRPALILSPPGAPAPGGPGRRAFDAAVAAAVAALAILVVWQGAMDAFGLNSFFAKRPADVWEFLVTAEAAGANRATLGAALAQTLAFTVPGYVAGLALGVGLAALLVLAPAAAAAALPVAIALRSIPIVTTAPLIVLALGRGAAGTISIVAVMIFFPTLVACLQGLRQAPGQVLDVFDSYAAGRGAKLAFAQVPAMLPAFFAAARMAVPAAVLAVTVAEWLATGAGVGNLMALTASTSNYNMLWSAVVALTVVSLAAHAGVGAVERRLLARLAPEQARR